MVSRIGNAWLKLLKDCSPIIEESCLNVSTKSLRFRPPYVAHSPNAKQWQVKPASFKVPMAAADVSGCDLLLLYMANQLVILTYS